MKASDCFRREVLDSKVTQYESFIHICFPSIHPDTPAHEKWISVCVVAVGYGARALLIHIMSRVVVALWSILAHWASWAACSLQSIHEGLRQQHGSSQCTHKDIIVSGKNKYVIDSIWNTVCEYNCLILRTLSSRKCVKWLITLF